MDASLPGSNTENVTGVLLAVSSSVFIGSSFILKKKGLKRAGLAGTRAGVGGYSYLKEPLWWAGLLTMVVGELANFAAYAFAPAIVVTPLGALSILVSAVLANMLLNERLNAFGVVGCILCVTGSLAIVLNSPQEQAITSVLQVWQLAIAPPFLLYACLAVAVTLALVWRVPPETQSSNILVYIAICSTVGSLSVVSCKALGIALKLTFEGSNQLVHPQTYAFAAVVATAVVTQMNYLNKALDLFNTAIVTPIYYVMFTTLTIAASMIMFKEQQSAKQVATQLSGFATIVCGTFLLHATKDLDIPLGATLGLKPSPSSTISSINSGGSGSGRGDLDGLELGPLPQRSGSAAGLRKAARQEEGMSPTLLNGDRKAQMFR